MMWPPRFSAVLLISGALLATTACEDVDPMADGGGSDAAGLDAGSDAAGLDANLLDAGPTPDGGDPDGDLPLDGAAGDAGGEPPRTCRFGAECEPLEWCDIAAGVCRPDVCDPSGPDGVAVCAGNAIRVCASDGSRFEENPCRDGRLCEDGPGGPTCSCARIGTLGCIGTDNDIYEFDSCGLRQNPSVIECDLPERCIEEEDEIFCSTTIRCGPGVGVCVAAEYCLDGRCVPDVCTPAPISNPNSRRFCDGNSVMRCNSEGSAFEVVQACATSLQCVTLAGDPGADCRCVANARLGCNAGDIYNFSSCGTLGSRQTDCASGTECVDGPEGPTCALRTSCTRDQDCGATGRFCHDGLCVPRVCAPGSQRCDGARAQLCDARGSGYTVLDDCTDGEVCSVSSGSATCGCTPNASLGCNDTDIYNIDSCGRARTVATACTEPETCLDSGAGPSCGLRPVCGLDAHCRAGDFCSDAGVCTARICTPGAQRCSGLRAERCDARGAGWSSLDVCEGGEACALTGGMARCACVPSSSLRCSDSDVYNFDSCGARGARATDCTGAESCAETPTGPACRAGASCSTDSQCGSGNLCEGGSCTPQVCTPGAQRCSPQGPEACNARGLGWTLLSTCTGGQACVTSGAVARCECSRDAASGCFNTDIYSFDSCGVPRTLTTRCDNPEQCVVGASGPTCAPRPGSSSCTSSASCASTEYCDDGACVPRVCTALARFCEGSSVRQCDASGSDSVLVADCDGGQVCATVGGALQCACATDARRGCSGGNVYRFDSCGNRGSLVTVCAGASVCVEDGSAASCATPPTGGGGGCTPGASQGCYQGDLYSFDSCDQPGSVVEACPGQVSCNEIGGPPACRSSVADESSPYWEQSCPLVQQIEHPTTLDADCRCFINRSPSSGIIDHCVGIGYVDRAARLGAGPDLRSQPQSHLNGGVIIGRELFVGADWSSSTRVDQGLVFAVNLDTGDRRIVSGGYDDAVLGFVETGSGPTLRKVIDVEQGADGNLYLLSVPPITADLEIVRVNPTTGNRALVWRGRDAAFGQCASGDAARLAVTYHDRVFGMSAAGDFYLAFRGAGPYSEGVGLVRIAATGASCSFVTRSGAAALNAYASSPVGGGWNLDRGFYAGFVEQGGQLYVLNDVYKALFRIDPTTGTRVRVSSAATSYGVLGSGPANFGGIGQRWLAYDATRAVMWTTGTLNARSMIAVDLSSGDRIDAFCRSTNPDAPWRDICLRGVMEGGYQNDGGFWIDPANGDPIVVHDNHTLVRVDLRNGNSARLSF